MSILAAIFGLVRVILRRRTTLALENLALRQQLAVLRRSVKRPRLRPRDRIFWVPPLWPQRCVPLVGPIIHDHVGY